MTDTLAPSLHSEPPTEHPPGQEVTHMLGITVPGHTGEPGSASATGQVCQDTVTLFLLSDRSTVGHTQTQMQGPLIK